MDLSTMDAYGHRAGQGQKRTQKGAASVMAIRVDPGVRRLEINPYREHGYHKT